MPGYGKSPIKKGHKNSPMMKKGSAMMKKGKDICRAPA